MFHVTSSDDEIIELCLIFCLLLYYNSLRNRSFLTRSALNSPSESAWAKLYHYGDDNSFLNLTGFNRHSFNELRSAIFGHEDVPARKRGRPMLLDEPAQLGLLLYFLGSPMHYKHICQLFGIVPSTASTCINNMLRLVCEKLKNHPYSKIKLPNEQVCWSNL